MSATTPETETKPKEVFPRVLKDGTLYYKLIARGPDSLGRDGGAAVNVFVKPTCISIKPYIKEKKYVGGGKYSEAWFCHESISISVKRGFQVYKVKNENGEKRIRNTNKNLENVDTIITAGIGKCCKNYRNGRKVGIRHSKEAALVKLIQKWAQPHLHLPLLNSKKTNLHNLLTYLLYPYAKEEVPEDTFAEVYSDDDFEFSFDFDPRVREGAKPKPKRHFGRNTIWRKYEPIIKNFPNSKGCRTLLEVSNKCLGKKRPKGINKRLGKFLESGNIKSYGALAAWYSWNKDVLPIDHIYEVFDEYYTLFSLADISIKKKEWKAFVKYVGKDRLISIMRATYGLRNGCRRSAAPYIWKDTITQWLDRRDEIEIPPGINDINEIHNIVARQYRRLGQSNFDMKQRKNILALDGMEIPNADLVIMVPKESHELNGWGEHFNNCVAGYADQIKNGRCSIMGAAKHGELVYCIELRNGGLSQCSGKHNKMADPKDREVLLDFLKSMDIIKESRPVTFEEEFGARYENVGERPIPESDMAIPF